MTGRRRICFALDLKDDAALIARYKAWHAPGVPPAAVNQSIRAAGIEEMEIFLCGNRLFMVMEVDETFSPTAKAAADLGNPVVQAWETQMDEFQQRLPWARAEEKWVEAKKIYALSDQP